jgi:hypothetical protein
MGLINMWPSERGEFCKRSSNRKALTLATALLPGSRRPRSARPVGQSGRHRSRKQRPWYREPWQLDPFAWGHVANLGNIPAAWTTISVHSPQAELELC